MAHSGSGGGSRFVVGVVSVLTFVAWSGSARAGDAVVTAPEAIVRTAPFEVAPEMARLHAGDKLPADDKPTGPWRRVRLADGRFGLVHDADIEVIASGRPIAEEPATAPSPAPVSFVAAAAPPPPASDFGAANGFVLSAERLFGYVHVSQKTTSGGLDQTEDTSSFALFTNPLSGGNVFSAPRLAVDTFAPYHVSLGGSVGYFHLSETPAGSPSGTTYSGFLIAPRVGFAAAAGPKVVMWPRVGFTFAKISIESAGQTVGDATAYALTMEVPIVVIVVPHVFVSFVPTVDLGLGGSDSSPGLSSSTSMSQSQTITTVGLQAAFGAFF